MNAAIKRGDRIDIDNGILQEQELITVVASARSRNEKIVMSNGCFDVIHAGHVDYLQQAKMLGDRLLIAVNDDDSVKKLKGEYRPVNNVENRMSVLAGLSSTDWICQFSEDTPERLIRLVKPDVLVKGADYSEDKIAGADFVLGYGGEVVTIPFQTQCSSSEIIEKLQANSSRKGK